MADHTLEPGNPDADQHNISAGFGYSARKWHIDGFYNVGIFQHRTSRNGILDGTYENMAHYLGVSAGTSF